MALPSAVILSDLGLHVAGYKASASLPTRAMLDWDGHALRDAEGKVHYVPIIAFATREGRSRFSAAVVDAVREAHPEALA